MGYVGICDEFGKGSLLIFILCYARSVVMCVAVGFMSFIFIFRILYLSLLRMYLLRLYYSGWWWWWGGDVSLRPSCSVHNDTRSGDLEAVSQ
jgi:hypothetical protein